MCIYIEFVSSFYTSFFFFLNFCDVDFNLSRCFCSHAREEFQFCKMLCFQVLFLSATQRALYERRVTALFHFSPMLGTYRTTQRC